MANLFFRKLTELPMCHIPLTVGCRFIRFLHLAQPLDTGGSMYIINSVCHLPPGDDGKVFCKPTD
jgi:hypothetical protein